MRIVPRQTILAAAVVFVASLMGAVLQGGQAAAQAKPMMVDDVFKNVQAMKGMSVDDFMHAMGFITAATGSDCISCHVDAGSEKVDWAFDTPRKIAARRMILMVGAINRDNFGGRQVVTCWSCHRGRDRPVVTMSLDYVYGEPNLELDDILPTGTGGPSVDQVLDKYLQALGGAQKLASMTSFVASGKSVGYRGFGGGGVVQIYAQAPDKRAAYIQFPEFPDRGESIRTFNGQTGWIATPLAIVPKYSLDGSERDGARVDAQLSFPGQIRQVLNGLRVAPPTTIDDKDVQVIQGTGSNGTIVTLYFDPTSGLLVRMLRLGRSSIGRIPTQIDYSDYRDVNGMKFPFRWTFTWLDGRDSFEFDNVRLNVPIEAARFGEPQLKPQR